MTLFVCQRFELLYFFCFWRLSALSENDLLWRRFWAWIFFIFWFRVRRLVLLQTILWNFSSNRRLSCRGHFFALFFWWFTVFLHYFFWWRSLNFILRFTVTTYFDLRLSLIQLLTTFLHDSPILFISKFSIQIFLSSLQILLSIKIFID